jgi:hypothetical protein
MTEYINNCIICEAEFSGEIEIDKKKKYQLCEEHKKLATQEER